MGCSTPTLMPLQFGVQPARLPCVTCKAAPRSADRLLVRASSCRGLVAAFAGAEGVALSRCAAQVCVCVHFFLCVAIDVCCSSHCKQAGQTNWAEAGPLTGPFPLPHPCVMSQLRFPHEYEAMLRAVQLGEQDRQAWGCRPSVWQDELA